MKKGQKFRDEKGRFIKGYKQKKGIDHWLFNGVR